MTVPHYENGLLFGRAVVDREGDVVHDLSDTAVVSMFVADLGQVQFTSQTQWFLRCQMFTGSRLDKC